MDTMEPIIVSISELKKRLSYYLRLTRSNMTVEITYRGKPIGRIIPFGKTLEERLNEAVKSGLISWQGKKLGPFSPVVKVRGKKSVSELITS